MKKILSKTLLTLLCLIGYTYITAQRVQSLPEVDGKVIYENLRLEKEGGKMILSFDTKILDKALNNRQSWKVMPELIPAGIDEPVFFPSLLINGRQKERHYNRRMSFKNKELLAGEPLIRTDVPQNEEQLIRYRAEIPFQSWMENSTLTFHQILTSPREKKQLFTTMGLARLVPAPKPQPPVISPVPPATVIPPPPAKTLTINSEAHIQFPVGKTDIRPTYMDNTYELEKIEKDIRRILDDEALTLISLHLTGYSSPEGGYSLNSRLSEGRTKALKAYLADKYHLASEIIRISSVPEDWERLGKLIEKSSLENKKEILAIIESSESEDAKENRLRAMPATWNMLLKEYFPLLRRVDYHILYKKE